MTNGACTVRVVSTAALTLTLIACGSSDSDEPAGADGAADDTVTLRIAGTVGGGFTELPLDAAADALKADGHDVEIIPLADPALNIEGLISGDFDLTVGDTGAALIAIQTQDAPIKAVAAGLGNAWGLYAKSDIRSCEDLDGRRIAIHSQESDSTAMLTNWINSECSGPIDPERLIIAGSPNRLAALLAGEVDVSPLEISDGLAVTAEGDQFHQLASFAQDLPDLRVTWAVASDRALQENAEAVALYLEAWANQIKKINADPAYFVELAETYAPDLREQDGFQEAVDLYTELGVYDETLGAELSMIEYTVEFYEQAGAIEPGLSAEDVADLSILQDVVAG